MNFFFMLETKVLDKNAEWLGIKTEQLMENAGKAVANEAKKLYKKWLILCGSGNNGGDGYVAARYIKNCFIIAVSKPKTKLARKNFRRAKAMGIPIFYYEKEKFIDLLEKCDGVIDAMLGVGLRGELKQPYKEIVEILNKKNKFILAVDVPTGFGCNLMLKANTTVTFHFIKEGMDENNCGKIILADIGIPKEAEEYVGIGDLIYYPKPKKESHKGENGIVAIIGGGPYTGAPALAAMASLRTGCDLAYICCPHQAWQVIASFSPNLIVKKMYNEVFTPADIREMEEIIEKADAILVGPGLGGKEITKDACKNLVEKYVDKKLFVIDADAIEALKSIDCNGNVIFTPHAGEFKELTGVKLPDNLEERKRIVKEEAKKRNAVILLKGYIDIISDGEHVKMNRIHNEAMTVGGTGDVLAGITVALLAKKVEPFYAACMAAFINGMAGNIAFEEKSYGLLASDIKEKIPEITKRYVE